MCTCVFVWSVSNWQCTMCPVGMMFLTPISVQLTPSTSLSLSLRKIHTYTHAPEQTCGMPLRFWTVGSSEQASLPTGNLELNPKKHKRRKPSLLLLLYPSPLLSLSLCVFVTHWRTFSSPLSLPLSLCFISLAFSLCLSLFGQSIGCTAAWASARAHWATGKVL